MFSYWFIGWGFQCLEIGIHFSFLGIDDATIDNNIYNVAIIQMVWIGFKMVTWAGHLRRSVNSWDWLEIDDWVCDRELYQRWLPLRCLRLLCVWQMTVIFSRVHLANERRPVAFRLMAAVSSSLPLFPYSSSSVIPLNPLELSFFMIQPVNRRLIINPPIHLVWV